MRKVTDVQVLEDYLLQLAFDDGQSGVVDLSAYVGEGVFAAWNTLEVFQSVRIGDAGELVWGEDIDLCSDALYLEVTGKRPDELFAALRRGDSPA